MVNLLLAIIYLSFISLGLPDALLGAAWPTMCIEFDVPVSYAGIVSIIISAGTIVSSLMSDRLTRRLGTAKVTAISVAMTAFALFGFSISGQYWMLLLWAIPYGLGAGSVDASINNYVALHYASRHMSWLHCMWGVGASVGPYIMGYAPVRRPGLEYGLPLYCPHAAGSDGHTLRQHPALEKAGYGCFHGKRRKRGCSEPETDLCDPRRKGDPAGLFLLLRPGGHGHALVQHLSGAAPGNG